MDRLDRFMLIAIALPIALAGSIGTEHVEPLCPSEPVSGPTR